MKNLNTDTFWDKKIKRERQLLEKDPMTKDRIKCVYDFIPKNKKIKLLDIGVGYGFVEEYLMKHTNIKIYGIDISTIAIKNLISKFKGKFKKESIYSMKFKEGYFDVILALEVLEHIPKVKNKEILRKINKLLQKKGSLIVSVPLNEGLNLKKYNPNAHLRNYTEKILRTELTNAGFTVESVKKLVAFKKMYTFKKFLSKLFTSKWKPNNIIIVAKKI